MRGAAGRPGPVRAPGRPAGLGNCQGSPGAGFFTPCLLQEGLHLLARLGADRRASSGSG